MKQRIRLGILLSICIVLLLPVLPVQAAERIVRVGWYERDGYYVDDGSGNPKGFGADYLTEVAEYANWKCQYLKGTRQQCLIWLQNGVIDIMAPVCVRDDIGDAVFAREIIGEDYGYLYKLKNNYNLKYDDYASLTKVTVGLEKGSGLERGLAHYCEENAFLLYGIKEYDTIEEMKYDLAKGKIDVIVADAYVNLENLKVVGRFSNDQVTFAVNEKQTELLEEMNNALEKIKLDNPTLSQVLYRRYFGNSSQNNLEYTAKEQRFLLQSKSYKVILTKQQYPITYDSSDGKEMKGILLDILRRIEYSTGLNFQIQYVDNHIEAETLFEQGKADMIGGCIISNQEYINRGKYSDRTYSDSFYEMDMSFVGYPNTDMEKAQVIAVPDYLIGDVQELEEMYPHYQYVVYNSDEECLQAVLDKRAGAAIQHRLMVMEIVSYDKYKELQNLRDIPGSYSAVFTINPSTTDLLVDVINKALMGMPESAMESIRNNNIHHTLTEHYSPAEFYRRYKGYLWGGMIAVLFMVTTLGYLIKYRREVKQREIAYRDRVADISSMEKFRQDVDPIIKGTYSEKQDYYLLAVDIDKFKIINDVYGYDEGDRVICFVANQLKAELGEEDFVSRINADNFIVMKKGKSLEEVERYLDRVFADIDRILEKGETHYRMILKAGIYPLRQDENNLSGALDRANVAKRMLTELHQSGYKLYSDEMRRENLRIKSLENEMDVALREEQFCIYLQPQIDLKTKKIVSAEALVRWIHPNKGLIPPNDFVPIFERNGFINLLDRFVWEEVIKTLARWKKEQKEMIPIAINLSRIDIQQEGMVEVLVELLKKYEMDTDVIKAELTESAYIEGDSVVMRRMQELKDSGLKIAIDDFGAGYSSLNLLKKMPVDILKIDREFLDDNMEGDSKNKVIIRSVIEMGKQLNLQIIVEGVETKEQSDFLEKAGCDIVQGYYYGRPVPVAEFEQMVKAQSEEGMKA